MRRKGVDKEREGYMEYVKDASMMTGALSVYREIVKNKIEKNNQDISIPKLKQKEWPD